MIKDIYLVISLSDQFFQLVHFSVVSQIAAVKDAIDCRGPTNKLKKLKYFISLTNINATKNYIKHAKLFLRLSLADFLPSFLPALWLAIFKLPYASVSKRVPVQNFSYEN